MDPYGFLWAPMNSCGIPMDSYWFLWIPMDVYGFPREFLWIPIELGELSTESVEFLWIPWTLILQFLWVPIQFQWILIDSHRIWMDSYMIRSSATPHNFHINFRPSPRPLSARVVHAKMRILNSYDMACSIKNVRIYTSANNYAPTYSHFAPQTVELAIRKMLDS